MTGKRKTTASVSSVGADGKQPNLKNDTEIIANETAQINLQATNNCKSPEKSGCSLQTVSMTELYDTLYPPRTPVVDGFLYGPCGIIPAVNERSCIWLWKMITQGFSGGFHKCLA